VTLVRYLATPVELFIELQQVLDGLQREVQISALDGGTAVAEDVVDGIVVQREKMASVRVALYEQAVAARDAGRAIADLEAEYPDDSVDQILAITAAARRAEDAASEGRLLGVPVSEELLRFQTWVFDQVETQLRGGPATPYRP
jgi:hypothetical protein